VVGTLLLGGKTRAELSASSRAGRPVASTETPSRIHVVRLAQTADDAADDAADLTPAAS